MWCILGVNSSELQSCHSSQELINQLDSHLIYLLHDKPVEKYSWREQYLRGDRILTKSGSMLKPTTDTEKVKLQHVQKLQAEMLEFTFDNESNIFCEWFQTENR